jgi:hypothetical protein
MQNFISPQQEVIQAVGFVSLLKLKELRIRRKLCKEIVDVYDFEKEEFNINENRLKITL